MRLRVAVVVAALTGFIALSYEIVWYRVLAIMTRGIAATFGLLLGAYLLGLAVGARASAALCRGPGGAERDLHRVAGLVVAANVVAAAVVPTLAWSAHFTDYRIGLVLIALGAALLGSVFPLVSHFAIEPDERAGSRVSYVYLANIVGSAAGSLVTGFVLMEHLSLASIARVLVATGFAVAAAIVAMSAVRGSRAATAYAALGVPAVLAVVLVPTLYDRVYERLTYKDAYDGTQRFAEIVENRSGVITVTDDGTVYGGGAYDGVLNTRLDDNERNGILRAYVIGALHPAPREVLVIGLSAGSWAEVVVHLPGVERVTIVEINPGYVDVIAKHAEVAGLLRNPKVTLVFDDGRRWLLRHPEQRFDFILMNTTMHWRGHITNLVSSEFMGIAREHLQPGGVFYFNTTDSYDVQLTAARAFPHLLRVTNFVAVSDTPFFFDRERWRRLLETMQIEGRPILQLDQERDRKIRDDLLGFNDMEGKASIVDRYEKTQTVVTDDNMVVEWREPLRYPEKR